MYRVLYLRQGWSRELHRKKREKIDGSTLANMVRVYLIIVLLLHGYDAYFVSSMSKNRVLIVLNIRLYLSSSCIYSFIPHVYEIHRYATVPLVTVMTNKFGNTCE